MNALSIIINFILTAIAAFSGVFLGSYFVNKRRTKNERVSIYNKLLEVLPIAIPISHGDIPAEHLLFGTPTASIKTLKDNLEALKTQQDVTATDADDTAKASRDSDISNAEHAISQLEQYINFYEQTMRSFNDFESAEHFNRFKVYASPDVRRTYADFYVALSNDYNHTGDLITSKNLNILLNQLVSTIASETRQ